MAMHYIYKGLVLDDTVRDYVEKRLSGLEKFLHGNATCDIVTSVDKKNQYTVEVLVETPGEKFHTKEVSTSTEASSDLVFSSIREQVIRSHDRRKTLTRRGARSIKKKTVIDTSARF